MIHVTFAILVYAQLANTLAATSATSAKTVLVHRTPNLIAGSLSLAVLSTSPDRVKCNASRRIFNSALATGVTYAAHIQSHNAGQRNIS